MKITKISLNDFHQFKDLEIDLTYPKGHKKEGEPLEKVCFIGQSGTGKTTLLKIIGGNTYNITNLFKEYKFDDFKNVYITRKEKDLEMVVRVGFDEKENKNITYWVNEYEDGKPIEFKPAFDKFIKYQSEIKNQFIYFPAELHYDEMNTKEINLITERIIDFSDYNLGDVWKIVLSKIQEHQETELKLRQKISKIAEAKNNISAITRAVKKLDSWLKNEFNPLTDLADKCLDPLLKNFNLRVKRELDFQKKDDLGFIKIEDFNGNSISQNLLSTGTKQVIFSAMPLYLLKPEDSLILYDEPERSLYPDIQKFIIDFYVNLTKNSQFFFATHSPIIASSFEPWEIVELKFNKKGEVVQELYYPEEKERHVDNYSIIPSYLTYDLILKKVFDLPETYSYKRSEKITEVLMLRNQLNDFKGKKQMDTKEAKDTYQKFKKLAEKLFWDIPMDDYEKN